MEGALRKVAADFGDDLRQDEIKKLMFLKDIPRGIQERLTNAVEVFQHLEERAMLDFRNPLTVIDMMREVNKEKWALDTEKLFGIQQQYETSDNLITPVVHTPEQESRKREFNIESDSQEVVRREQPPTAIKLSNSFNRHMKLHDDQFSPVDEMRDGVCSTQAASCSGEQDYQETTDMNDRAHGTPECVISRTRTSQCIHTRLTRNHSSASKRSSGYVSGVWEPADFDCEGENEMISEGEEDYYHEHKQYFQSLSPNPDITSRSSTLGSKSSSHDGYTTANDDEDEGISDSKDLLSPFSPNHCKNSLVEYCNKLYSPPCNGIQKFEGDMEVSVKELQKAVEKSTSKQPYQSYPFPSFSTEQGIQFQIHLYPVSLKNPSSCAVYLVVLGWSPDKLVKLPKFEINVSTIQSTLKGKNATSVDEMTVVDVMEDVLPPTPSNVDYTTIALFPSLIPHTELFKLESGKTIVIKATLIYKAPIPL